MHAFVVDVETSVLATTDVAEVAAVGLVVGVEFDVFFDMRERFFF